MENKEKEKASNVIVTRNIYDLSKGTENIYESVSMLSKRANQIATEDKKELHQKIDEFATQMDTMDEMFENREQIDIVRRAEIAPKPTLVATQEYLDDELYYRNPAKEDQEMQKLAEEENRVIIEEKHEVVADGEKKFVKSDRKSSKGKKKEE
jgi:DNA-directed RNA polymerase subunit K/omega